MRKLLIFLTILSLTAGACMARSLPDRYSPFQYSHRWYFSFQAGPVLSATEYMDSFAKNGKWFDSISWHGALAFGYNFTDAWDLRISGIYGYNAGALSPYQGFYPYRFHSAQLFADMILNYNALAEYNVPFNFKTYIGLGGAYTFGFTNFLHPYQVLDSPNLVPAPSSSTTTRAASAGLRTSARKPIPTGTMATSPTRSRWTWVSNCHLVLSITSRLPGKWLTT